MCTTKKKDYICIVKKHKPINVHIQSYLKKQPKSNSIQFKYLTVYTSQHIYELIVTGLDDRDLLEELQIICNGVTNYEDAILPVQEFINEVYEKTDYYYNKCVKLYSKLNSNELEKASNVENIDINNIWG